MLLVSLASSAVVAAPASVQACEHEWESAEFLETVVDVVGSHQCTICGKTISLFQKKMYIYVHVKNAMVPKKIKYWLDPFIQRTRVITDRNRWSPIL